MSDKGMVSANRISATEARTRLGEIIERANGEKPERFVIGKRGGQKVIVMGLEDYLETIMPPVHPLMAEFHAKAKANGTDKMTMEEIDAEIAAARAERRAMDAQAVCHS